MRNPIVFITLLFCMAAASLLPGAMALWERVDYWSNGRAAVMVLADPSRKPIIPTGGPDIHSVNVRYVGADGEIAVPEKLLDGATARRLAAGERIPITYLKGNVRRVYFQYDEPANPWGWLIVGLGLLALGTYAVKLYRRESGTSSRHGA